MKSALTRREMFALGGAAMAAVRLGRAQAPRPSLGVASNSFSQRLGYERENGGGRLQDALGFLEHCRGLGAEGIQVELRTQDKRELKKLRKTAEKWEMYLEATVRLPSDASELDGFRDTLNAAQLAGITVLHTPMLLGRRYEVFLSDEAFLDFARQAWKSLTISEPVLRKRGFKLAVENHTDWRSRELLNIMERISSESVGICMDTGNNIALLEDPLELAEAFAPYVFSVHLKDMAVQETPEGFLLADKPLGEGYLNLPRIVKTLRQANQNLHFNIETITRDPLHVPCLTENYWATLKEAPGRDLAMTLAAVRRYEPEKPLQRVSHLPAPERLSLEAENVRRSIDYARRLLAG